jgi:hypothetical protein
MCSATDSAPVPRNWNPLRGVRLSIPASNRKFAMFTMRGFFHSLPCIRGFPFSNDPHFPAFHDNDLSCTNLTSSSLFYYAFIHYSAFGDYGLFHAPLSHVFLLHQIVQLNKFIFF